MSATAPPPVSFAEALRFWLKLGFISFGGPTGQIAIMHQELVERRRWISEQRFLHALNFCMVLPGPEATQLATYIGWLMHRTWGGIVAGVLFVLPSVFILIALSWIYVTYGKVPLVAGIFYGIKPAVVAIVLAAAWRIAQRALKHPALWVLAAAAFVAIFAFDTPFPAIVLAAGIIGYAGGRHYPGIFSTKSNHKGQGSYGPALIDDDTPTPAHALFSWAKLGAYAGAGLGLWALVIGGLAAAGGWDGTLAQMGLFFSQAALLTFGGAYAVLPYVYQGAVEHYGWLTGPQMIDGLALGETTPGPLIMVVAFVGYLGAGAAGALVATYFTFLPSFIFIFAGAPFVETTHGDLKFSAPLTGITAAVVGVIVNLAVFFAWHVLWPAGAGGHFDWISALIGAAAFAALFRFKVAIMPVIGACALAGLLATFIQPML
jgi:chromate transporter